MSLSQPTLLMTRPLAASNRFVASLDQRLLSQVEVITSPLVQIEYMPKHLELDGMAGVIFTSAHGVHAAGNVQGRSEYAAYCVGSATTQAAVDAGWHAHRVGKDAVSLIAALLAQKPNGPLLHIRGEHARGDIAKTLTKQGLHCDEVVMYCQTAQPFSDEAMAAMHGDSTIIVPLFSPRAASLFRQGALNRAFEIVAMSAAVAEEVQAIKDWSVATARAPDAHEMRVLVENLLQSHVPG